MESIASQVPSDGKDSGDAWSINRATAMEDLKVAINMLLWARMPPGTTLGERRRNPRANCTPASSGLGEVR